MRERLGEVPELPLGLRVVLLRHQAEVVAEIDEPIEERVRFAVAAQQLVAVAEPEGARKEHALARRQSVDAGSAVRRAVFLPGFAGSACEASSHGLVCAVPKQEAVLEQLA